MPSAGAIADRDVGMALQQELQTLHAVRFSCEGLDERFCTYLPEPVLRPRVDDPLEHLHITPQS